MNKKIIAACCVLAIAIASLGGCSLAKEGAGTAGEDRLIGMFITTEYIDTFNYEAYFSDNAASIGQDGEIILDDSTQEYTGRIYATQTADSTDSGDINSDYVFEGLDGIRYFVVKVTDESGTYHANVGDEGISDGHMSIKSLDGEDSIGMEGTLYITPEATGDVYYLNPVYQSDDGRVYVVQGSGFGGAGVSEGVNSSSTMEANYTATENGETTTYSCSITISFTGINTPEKLVILQMSADNTVLAREEYEPGSAPEAITTESKAAYIIAESYGTDSSGTIQVKRALYGKDDTMIISYECGENGICIGQYTQLNWR